MQVVVLASGSQYRAQLLKRLDLPFQVICPDIDETVQKDETPETLARRLAREKAQRVAQILQQNPSNVDSTASGASQNTIIIASDQVACFDDTILGKPGTVTNACAQLATMSGKAVRFLTSLHMFHVPSGKHFEALDVTVATLRTLDNYTIERYVAADNPLDCAGSFKVEAKGISLFSSISSQDPTALIGLSMISVCEGLRQFGVYVP